MFVNTRRASEFMNSSSLLSIAVPSPVSPPNTTASSSGLQSYLPAKGKELAVLRDFANLSLLSAITVPSVTSIPETSCSSSPRLAVRSPSQRKRAHDTPRAFDDPSSLSAITLPSTASIHFPLTPTHNPIEFILQRRKLVRYLSIQDTDDSVLFTFYQSSSILREHSDPTLLTAITLPSVASTQDRSSPSFDLPILRQHSISPIHRFQQLHSLPCIYSRNFFLFLRLAASAFS